MKGSAGSTSAVQLADGNSVPQDLFDSTLKTLHRLKLEQPMAFKAIILCSDPFLMVKPAGQLRRSLTTYQLVDAQTGNVHPNVQSIVQHVTVSQSAIDIRPEFK